MLLVVDAGSIGESTCRRGGAYLPTESVGRRSPDRLSPGDLAESFVRTY